MLLFLSKESGRVFSQGPCPRPSLSSATPFHSESTRRFFPLFLHDPQKLGNAGACGGTRRDVDITLSIGTGAVYPWVFFPTFQKEFIESSGVSCNCLLAVVTCDGGSSVIPCLLCAGRNTPASPPSPQTRRPRCSGADVWQRASQLQVDGARF